MAGELANPLSAQVPALSQAEVAIGGDGPQEEDSPRYLISDLCNYLESYLDTSQIQEIYRAYLFGAEAHDGQHRMSGEPYIFHPVAVARILAEMRLDHHTLMAAILHDVIEDTNISKDQLAELFGAEVADLVDGVSKLTAMGGRNQAERQAENFRKMLLAMSRDIRVIIIKLADRLHNMRTLGVMRPDKRRRIARETLEIYVPIAQRLGMNEIRLALEDLGFANSYPKRYRILATAMRRARGNRKEILANIQTAIRRRMHQENIPGDLYGREKHLYSIYRKMREKRLSFSDVFDVYGFRIVVDRVDTCYRALGLIHNLYKPVPGRFKDYIAIPKANGYQSLHTTLFGPHGIPIEVQIRTEEMNQVAESGVAAHWVYKSDDSIGANAQARASEWLRNLLELQKGAGNSVEFIEHVKVDLFPDEVYVFTPAGDIMKLPQGATVVDFAYAVHSGVGNSCVAGKVDRRLAPLRSVLQSGQTVEIITAPGASPSPSWLNFVVTGKARANIRAFLKNFHRAEAVELGRRLLNKELAHNGVTLDSLPALRVPAVLHEFKLESLDDLLADIGLGNRVAPLVVRRLLPDGDDNVRLNAPISDKPLIIKGTEGMVLSLARCCRPIPGDPIIGCFTAGQGLTVHIQGCHNASGFLKRSENWIEVQWSDPLEGDFASEVRIEVANERGVLATVAAAISGAGSNIENVQMKEKDGMTSTLIFLLTVRDRGHLARVMRRIRGIRSVIRISRSRS
ncbi:MAG: bifunctional GTP diphosphokinase/guanosine-3',5'-bis pyrophosphate 3'-pyrophosphohydrolase [Chromatiales bacterium]|nr:bifunctional GTP diphosphokinase/guanosine-3',5'-bis pyrophosphate 3'-pyrophosphohydrolase [Chromatiales bacterium]